MRVPKTVVHPAIVAALISGAVSLWTHYNTGKRFEEAEKRSIRQKEQQWEQLSDNLAVWADRLIASKKEIQPGNDPIVYGVVDRGVTTVRQRVTISAVPFAQGAPPVRFPVYSEVPDSEGEFSFVVPGEWLGQSITWIASMRGSRPDSVTAVLDSHLVLQFELPR